MLTTRQHPNILITGTPGTGKTTTSDLVARAAGLQHLQIGELVKAEQLHCGWDDENDCFIIDEDKVCDYLEEKIPAGGFVVDYHGCDFFPESWFDLVVVLQTDNTLLYDRLAKRGYAAKKISENVECEIMMVILEEAAESYRQEVVVALPSNTVEDMESNIERICSWVQQYSAQAPLHS